MILLRETRSLELLRLTRPHQWLKNGFVLVGVVFAQVWIEPIHFVGAVSAAIAFTLVSAGVYILNDLSDVDEDRRHPRKRLRPLAAKAVDPRTARILMWAMWGAGAGLGSLISPALVVLLGAYVSLNVAYSHALKRIPVFDVLIIALGFVLRLLAGTVGIGIEPSMWLLVTGTCVAMFFAFAKRRAEFTRVRHDARMSRSVLGVYTVELLDRGIAWSALCGLTAYGLYTVHPSTIARHGGWGLVATFPVVVIGLLRYLRLLYRHGRGEEPSVEFVRDLYLGCSVGAWLVLTIVALRIQAL